MRRLGDEKWMIYISTQILTYTLPLYRHNEPQRFKFSLGMEENKTKKRKKELNGKGKTLNT